MALCELGQVVKPGFHLLDRLVAGTSARFIGSRMVMSITSNKGRRSAAEALQQ
jgi:hypothetical protein